MRPLIGVRIDPIFFHCAKKSHENNEMGESFCKQRHDFLQPFFYQ